MQTKGDFANCRRSICFHYWGSEPTKLRNFSGRKNGREIINPSINGALLYLLYGSFLWGKYLPSSFSCIVATSLIWIFLWGKYLPSCFSCIAATGLIWIYLWEKYIPSSFSCIAVTGLILLQSYKVVSLRS
ncbi:hypothetical protein AVEN_67952-1 [Araneus ventricosus]|uniref:Uncharacterized protein n=1 Tax=Araneus ventricosus TaxID=182803 RepID=A0A4Y2QB41_ARAVE|nr:hypothetical protein AVEN_67952-1 [Araneus ventricosus]